MSVLDLLDGDSRSKRWIKRHLDYSDQEWCLIWPFSASRNGYAYFGGDHIAVHRLMCEHRNGPPPTLEHQAAHCCGRGHEACVNPWHVSWKTTAENQEERYQHSGPTRRAKLTPEQVDEIRALNGRAKINDIAAQFGISDTNVRHILAGKLWKAESPRQRVFSEAEVILIRATPWQEKSAGQWAREFGVHRAVIDRIRGGHSYKWVTEQPCSQHNSPESKSP
jgi:hypothetical protein